MKYTINNFETLHEILEATTPSPEARQLKEDMIQGYLKCYIKTVLHLDEKDIPEVLPPVIRFTGEIKDNVLEDPDYNEVLTAVGLLNKVYKEEDFSTSIIED